MPTWQDLSGGISQTQERNFEQKRQVSLLFRSPSADFRRSKNAPSSVTALILGVSERTIQRWKPESLKQKRLSQEEVLKIQELKEEGKTSFESSLRVSTLEIVAEFCGDFDGRPTLLL